jgi:putative ABC transport system permease protein
VAGWRTALRIAWREARRAKARSAMVLAMIALPVLALSYLAVGYDTFNLDSGERADRLMGRTQAVLRWDQSQPVEQDPFELTAFGWH